VGRASHPCNGPQCHRLLEAGAGARCPACQRKSRQQSRARNPRHDQVYGSKGWRSLRASLLPPGAPPDCVDCQEPASELDHVPPRRILLALGVHSPDHPRWLEPRCKGCHSRVTARIDVELLARLEQGEAPELLAEESITRRRSRRVSTER